MDIIVKKLPGEVRLVLKRLKEITGINLCPLQRLFRVSTTKVGKDLRVELFPYEWVRYPKRFRRVFYFHTKIDPMDAQLSTLLYLSTRIDFEKLKVEGRKVINVIEKDKESERKTQLRLMASLIEGDRLRRLTLKSDKGESLPRGDKMNVKPVETAPWMGDIYRKYVKKTGDSVPLEQYDNSRLTGTTVNGVAAGMSEIGRPDQPIPEKAGNLLRALYLVEQSRGWNADIRIPAPKFEPGYWFHIESPTGTSAGIRLVHESMEEIGRFRLIITAKGKKEDAINLERDELEKITEILRRRFTVGGYYYDREIYGVQATVLMQKVEAKGPNDDPNKNRIFFIVSLFIYLLYMGTLGPIAKYQYGKGNSMVGAKWFDGDAERLGTEFSGFKAFEDYDYSRFDQSLLSQLIMHVNAMDIMYFKPGDVNYLILKHHVTYLVEQGMFKIVEWPDGDYRLAIGMNFSGGPDTTTVNEKYHTVLVVSHLMQRYQMQETSERARKAIRRFFEWLRVHQFDEDPKERQAYWNKMLFWFREWGDDGIMAASDDEILDELGLKTFVPYTQKWNMLIKWKNTNRTNQFHSELDSNDKVILRESIRPDGSKVMKPTGLTFLKRQFVKFMVNHEGVTMPWKDADDYYWKFGRSPAADQGNPLVQFSRTYGLMIDTLGVNRKAYEFLSVMNDIVHQRFNELNPEIEIPQNKSAWKEFQLAWNRATKLGNSGLTMQDFLRKPNFEKMQQRIAENSFNARGELLIERRRREEIGIVYPRRYIDDPYVLFKYGRRY